jgi:rhodanese-related sulfurtransferase
MDRLEGRALNWTTTLVIFAVIALAYTLKRARQISSADALEFLKNGAVLIDVRSVAKFTSGHLPQALNLPLDEIETLLPRSVKDKNQVLLHCQSGMRSGVAKTRLKALGYANVFNLGSYARATHIVIAR